MSASEQAQTGSAQAATAALSPEELTLVFIDQSKDAKDFARDQADARLTQELSEGNRAKRFINGIWKGNIAKDYYRQKYTAEARAEIASSQDILTFHATDPMRRQDAMSATIQRFQSEFDETLHGEAGEVKTEVSAQSEITIGLKDLIRQYAAGTLSDAALLEERTRVLEAYREAHGDNLFGEGIVRVDNILSVAQAVKGAVAHGESIDRIFDSMKIVAGESRSGVRTEARYNKVDRAIEKLNQSKVGSLVGPEVIAASVTTAASLLRLGSRKVVGALAMTVAPGVASGIFAGLRESKRTKDDRAQHSREMAMGKDFDDSSKRRLEMESTRYHSAPAQELTGILNARFTEDGNLSDINSLRTGLDELGAVETRIRMSDSRHMDLVTYSDPTLVEEERLALDIARAQAKTILEQRLDPAIRQQLGIDESMPLQEILEERSTMFANCLEREISEKDKAFQKLKARRIATATATGVLTGLTFGVLAQEGIASLSDTRQGLVEQLWRAKGTPINGDQHQTVAYGLFNGDQHNLVTTRYGPSSTYNQYGLGKNGSISISGDHSIVNNPNGTLRLTDQTGNTTLDNLAVNPDGSLPTATLQALSAKGMVVENLSHSIDNVTTTKTQLPVEEYIAKNPDSTTAITRDLWYDNGTSAPVFDKNELELDWSNGDKGSGLQKNGDFTMSVANMTSSGSSHEGQAVNWANSAAEGNLKLAISATANTQTQAFMVNIQPDGRITIPAGSVASQFFTEQNGQAVFTGKYAEVVQMTGKGTDGVEHVRPLATLVGEGKSNISGTVETRTPEFIPDYKITTAGYDTTAEQDTFTEMAPVIPVISRKSLETMRRDIGGGYYGYNQYISPEEIRRQREETSPRLNRNPDADLNSGEELRWHKEQVRKRSGKAYVENIEKSINKSPELSKLSSELKAIIMMPVNASGKAESENIYKTLSVYAQQDSDSLNKAMMLLHVNWFDDAAADPEKRQAIERTKSEIARAKADFPELKIATIETQWERAKMQNGVIGHVGRRLHDAALFALEVAMTKGDIPEDRDILLIRNDADPKGLSRHYLKRYIDEAEKHPKTDIFTGTTSFDNTKADRLPGFVFAANFMQSLNLLQAAREHGAHTGGANFAVRASALAACGEKGGGGEYSGAGSDDVEIGRRISRARTARQTYYGANRQKLKSYVESWRRQKNSGSYARTDDKTTTSRRVGRRITGARIDTDSDREEALYLSGIPIVKTWDNGFDTNGYVERDARLKTMATAGALSRVEDEIDRIVNDITGSINFSHASDAVIRSSLAFMFGSKASAAYQLGRRGGRYTFSLTEVGRKHIADHLTRDKKGRFDPYGSRKLRQMYGEAKPGAKRQPVARPMIRV